MWAQSVQICGYARIVDPAGVVKPYGVIPAICLSSTGIASFKKVKGTSDG
jgi:hypothetical protein